MDEIWHFYRGSSCTIRQILPCTEGSVIVVVPHTHTHALTNSQLTLTLSASHTHTHTHIHFAPLPHTALSRPHTPLFTTTAPGYRLVEAVITPSSPTTVVPANVWFGAFPTSRSEPVLVGCTTAPGFHFGRSFCLARTRSFRHTQTHTDTQSFAPSLRHTPLRPLALLPSSVPSRIPLFALLTFSHSLTVNCLFFFPHIHTYTHTHTHTHNRRL
jgi:predicted cupin superfamily sugar epimerase